MNPTNAAEWSTEKVHAHLTLRGWRPVRTACGTGIYNGDEGNGWMLFEHHDPVGRTFGFERGKVYAFDSTEKTHDITWGILGVRTLHKIAQWCWEQEITL